MFDDTFNQLCLDINQFYSAEIPENVLVVKYLPLIFDKDPSVFNMAWVKEVAGTPINPVKIIGSNNEVVGEVPPLRATPKGAKDDNFVSYLNLINLETEKFKHLVRKRAEHTLTQITDMNAPNTVEIRDKWIALLEKYGFKEQLKALNMNNNTQPNSLKTSTALNYLEEEDDW